MVLGPGHFSFINTYWTWVKLQAVRFSVEIPEIFGRGVPRSFLFSFIFPQAFCLPRTPLLLTFPFPWLRCSAALPLRLLTLLTLPICSCSSPAVSLGAKLCPCPRPFCPSLSCRIFRMYSWRLQRLREEVWGPAGSVENHLRGHHFEHSGETSSPSHTLSFYIPSSKDAQSCCRAE